MKRVVALDIGQKRIGVAVSDSRRTMGFPRPYFERSGDDVADRRRLVNLIVEEEPDTVVVGMPLSLDGVARDAANGVAAEVELLRNELLAHEIDVVTVDERFTTKSAAAVLSSVGHDSRAIRHKVDSVAAVVLLEHWLGSK